MAGLELLRTPQAADLLCVSESKLEHLRTCGRCPAFIRIDEGKCGIALPTFMRSWMPTQFPPATITEKAAPLPVTASNVCLQLHYTVTGVLPQPKIEVITHDYRSQTRQAACTRCTCCPHSESENR